MALVLGLFVVLTSQVYAANFSLSPASDQFKQGCAATTSILIDSEGGDVYGIDVLINYNPQEIKIIDQNLDKVGVQIVEGNIFDAYFYNTVDEENGVIKLTAVNIMAPYKTGSSSDLLAMIVFESINGVNNSGFTFDYTAGSTVDSNISDIDSNDLLTSVGNANYSFIGSGFCGSDTVSPYVNSEDPVPNSTNNALDSNISFDVLDDLSGVDISTLVVKVNGENFSVTDSELTYTGGADDYRIIVNPEKDFIEKSPVFVEIDASDLDGNIMSTYRYTFNQPVLDKVPPYVTNPDPRAGANGVALDSNISFHIKDEISGVDLDSLIVEIEGISYKFGDSALTYSGDPNDYFVTVDPNEDFIKDDPVNVVINAKDFDGNLMSPYSYSFNHPFVDNVAPYVKSLDPESGARAVDLDTNISFSILDNLAGVDIDTVIVTINDELFKIGDSEFLYTGEDLDYRVTIDLNEDLPANELITVEIDGSDLRGNVMDTFVYRFNRPAVCGDFLVEEDFGEECEPPNSSSCSEDCLQVACEIIEDEVAICGNGIIDEGEECEPPGLGSCNEDCSALKYEEEQQEHEFAEAVETSKLAGLLMVSEDENAGLEELSKDLDSDGLPDIVEKELGLSSDNVDSDGDGIGDLEEILDYGTDPLVADDLVIDTRIVNWKDGDITGSARLFVKGVGYSGKNVRVYAISEGGSTYFLGEDIANEGNIFSVLSEIALDEGKYDLVAESYEDNGELIDVSEKINITIDYQFNIKAPYVKSINEVPYTGVVVIVKDRTPTIIGHTEPGSNVFVQFQSKTFSAQVVSDASSGLFMVKAPYEMELGAHEATLYAVSPSGIVSEPLRVDFEVFYETTTIAPPATSYWWLVLLILLIITILACYYYNMRIVILNWKNGDIIKDELFKIIGRGLADKKVQVIAVQVKEDSKESLEEEEQILLGEELLNKKRIFSLISKQKLNEGLYQLFLKIFTEEGEFLKESSRLRVVIDYSDDADDEEIEF